MPLREDIEQSRDRALFALEHAHDYFAYTKDAWRTIQQDIERKGRKLTWTNTSTGTSVTETDVAARAQRYVEIELASSSLQQFVSIFENFLFEIARTWTLVHPERLSKRQLTGEVIFRLADKTAIVQTLVEKELQEVFYDRPANWFEYMKTLSKISSPSDVDGRQFAEINATRDIFVHGQ